MCRGLSSASDAIETKRESVKELFWQALALHLANTLAAWLLPSLKISINMPNCANMPPLLYPKTVKRIEMATHHVLLCSATLFVLKLDKLGKNGWQLSC